MKFSLIFLLGIIALTQAQIAVGPNGVSTSPINLLTVFKFVKNIFTTIFYPSSTAHPQSRSTAQDNYIDDREGKRIGGELETSRDVGVNRASGIIEKFDSNCEESGTCAEQPTSVSAESKILELEIENEDLEEKVSVVDIQKTGTSQLIVNKWSAVYLVLISLLLWPFLVLATPYFFTGIPLRREDNFGGYDYFNSDDILLLLSWLLGEVSEDRSCLEAVVCRSAPRSSQYITMTSTVMNVARFFKRWLPYSSRLDRTISELEGVAANGISGNCEDYYCENLPNTYSPNQYYYDSNYIDDVDPNYDTNYVEEEIFAEEAP